MSFGLYVTYLAIFGVLFSTNDVDPNEVPYCAASHLGLQCLHKSQIEMIGINGLKKIIHNLLRYYQVQRSTK